MIVTKFFSAFGQMLVRGMVLLVLTSPALPGQDLAPPTARDIWQIGQRELEFLNEFQPSPQGFLVDAYAQYLGSKGEVLTDSWNLARVGWGPNGFTIARFELPEAGLPTLSNTGKQKPDHHLKARHKRKASQLAADTLQLQGVVPMIFLDTAGVGADRYSYQYLGVEQLGALRTWTFILKPKETAGAGAFSGKIWVAGHHIVRFTGTFVNPAPREKGTYLSFDSVRYKGANGRWLPWQTYLDQTGLAPSAPGRALRARINVWGLDAQAAGLSSSTGFRLDDNVDSSHVAEAQSSSEDVYLEAESNLIRWLTGIGFLAPEGKFERDVCDPIIQDILDANRITLDRTLSCRVLLTVPAETVLFESVIGISKTAFDLTPNTASVAVLLAREVALAKVRANHLDLVWGRADTLTLHDEQELINLLRMTPSQVERDEADDLAMEYLAQLKAYKPQDLETSGIFLYTASEACETRPSLLAPRFGDGLPGCGRKAHISRMALAAPPGSDADPAMYVGSRTEIEPFHDSVALIKAEQQNAAFRVIPEPMIPKIAPDDPDPISGGIARPPAPPHLTPPPALPDARTK
jgi:hypothetical protein